VDCLGAFTFSENDRQLAGITSCDLFESINTHLEIPRLPIAKVITA